jgi:cytochrome c553
MERDQSRQSRLAKLRTHAARLVGYALILLVVGVVGAGLLVSSGFANASVRSGFIFPAGEILPFARARSVAFHSRFVEEPPESLDSMAMIRSGATHYADACADCHGAPGVEQPAYIEHMIPSPPHLSDGDLLNNRSKEELYFVLLNGIRHSGMPAWPSLERTDEPWTTTAFLLQMREGMSPERYLELTGQREQDALVREELPSRTHDALENCVSCHGVEGVGSSSGAYPNLTLLDERYIRESLAAYDEGRRNSGIMKSQLANLTSADLDRLAAHYGSQPRQFAGSPGGDRSLIQRGREIAEDGVDSRGVAGCVSCHGILEQTDSSVDERALYYPHLAGQYAPYLRWQLRAWADEARGGLYVDEPREIGRAHV